MALGANDLLSAGTVLLPAILGAILGSLGSFYFATRRAQLDRRRALYREILYISGRMQMFTELVTNSSWWQRWTPVGQLWQQQVLGLMEEYISLGSRAVAELVLDDEPVYHEVAELFGRIVEIQSTAASRYGALKPGADYSSDIREIIGELRDIMKRDLAQQEMLIRIPRMFASKGGNRDRDSCDVGPSGSVSSDV